MLVGTADTIIQLASNEREPGSPGFPFCNGQFIPPTERKRLNDQVRRLKAKNRRLERENPMLREWVTGNQVRKYSMSDYYGVDTASCIQYSDCKNK